MTKGTFTIVAGPMTGASFEYNGKTGLGKTTTAIEVANHVASIHGADAVLALQPVENTRDGGFLKGKNKEIWHAVLVSDPHRISERLKGVRVLLIDEAHLWLGKHAALATLCMKARAMGIDVWLFGCDTDHCNKPFPWFALMKPLADKVHYVTGRCQCGRRATKTFRHGLSEEAICVDTNEGHYESVCGWPCFWICFVMRKIRRLFRKKGVK